MTNVYQATEVHCCPAHGSYPEHRRGGYLSNVENLFFSSMPMYGEVQVLGKAGGEALCGDQLRVCLVVPLVVLRQD